MSRRPKPIKIFFSPLTSRFYASRTYKQEGNVFTITGEKFDVTNDIAELIVRHGIKFQVATLKDGEAASG